MRPAARPLPARRLPPLKLPTWWLKPDPSSTVSVALGLALTVPSTPLFPLPPPHRRTPYTQTRTHVDVQVQVLPQLHVERLRVCVLLVEGREQRALKGGGWREGELPNMTTVS